MSKIRSSSAARKHQNLGSLFVADIPNTARKAIHPYWFQHGIFHLLAANDLQTCESLLLHDDYVWTRLLEDINSNGYMLQRDYRDVFLQGKNPILGQWKSFIQESTSMLSRGGHDWSRAYIWHQLCEEVSPQNPFFPYRPNTTSWRKRGMKLRRTHLSNESWRKAVLGAAEIFSDGIIGAVLQEEKLVCWNYKGVAVIDAQLENEPLHLAAEHGMTRGASLWREDILTWGEDGIICRWDITGELVSTQTIGIPIASLHWVDEKSVLLYACSPWYDPEEDPEDGTIIHWDLQAGEQILSFEAHEGDSISGLMVDQNQVVSWDRNGFIIEWNLKDGHVVRSRDAHKGSVVALSRLDASRYISTGREGKHRIWEWGKKKPHGKMNGIAEYRGHICIGQHIAAWDDEGALSFHALNEKKPLAVQAEHSSWIEGALHWQENIIITWTNNLTAVMQLPPDPTLRVWDISTGQLVQELHGHQEGISRVIKHNGKLFSASLAAEIICWGDPLNPNPAGWNGHSSEPTALLPATKGELFSSAHDGCLYHTNPKDYTPRQQLPRLLRRMATFTCGKHLVSITYEGQVDIFDQQGQGVNQFDIFAESDVHGVLIPWYQRPFGQYALGGACCDDDSFWVFTRSGGLSRWSIEGERLCDYLGHEDCVANIFPQPTGQLISFSWDNTAIVWNEHGQIQHHWKKFKGWPWAFLQLDDNILIGDMEGKILLYNPASGRLMANLKGMKGAWVLGFLRLHDGRILAYGHSSKVRIWKPSTEKNWKTHLTFKGHGVVFGAMQLANGDCASWDEDGLICVWSSQNAKTLWHYSVAEEQSESEMFAAKNAILGAIEIDNCIVLWTAKLEWFCLQDGKLLAHLTEEEAAIRQPQWVVKRQQLTQLRATQPTSIAWPDGEGRRRLGQEDRFARLLVFHHQEDAAQWHHHDVLKVERYDQNDIWVSDARGDVFLVQAQHPQS